MARQNPLPITVTTKPKAPIDAGIILAMSAAKPPIPSALQASDVIVVTPTAESVTTAAVAVTFIMGDIKS
jgi:hypothetical protein